MSFPKKPLYLLRELPRKANNKDGLSLPSCEATETALIKAWSEHIFLVNYCIFPAWGLVLLMEDMMGVQ